MREKNQPLLTVNYLQKKKLQFFADLTISWSQCWINNKTF